MKGFLKVEGLRTSKTFTLKNPKKLLQNWLENYSIVEKCRMWTYSTGFQDREQLLKALKQSISPIPTVLALHSSAEKLKLKNTNLQTLELYLLDPESRISIENILQLEPQERGYEVLLIEPYYKSLLNLSIENSKKPFSHTSPLLTFLDLYHFPLRGQEQAEFMAERNEFLKQIYKKGR
jgi:hypothetical protein